ncbi:MAG: pantoate--beta-alanine ligase, partial [Elusimicrobiota bacterium]
HMVKTLHLPVKIISCPTIRESDGLAMSSRNILLTSDERENASHISQTLFEAKKKYKEHSVDDLKKWVTEQINDNPFLTLEYFEVTDAETLNPVSYWVDTKNIRACIAVKIGNIRLIDNIRMC